MLYSFLRFIAAVISRVLLGFKAEGLEYIPKKGGFILASNHASYLDPVLLAVACPRKLSFMARHDLFSIPVLSQVISRVGAFPVKRDSADLSAIKEAMRRVRAGSPLLLFPEGRRRDYSDIQQTYPGIGFLAAKLNVPVVPAFVSGTEKAMPRGARFIRPARVLVRFKQQIVIDGKMPYEDIAKLIMKRINS